MKLKLPWVLLQVLVSNRRLKDFLVSDELEGYVEKQPLDPRKPPFLPIG